MPSSLLFTPDQWSSDTIWYPSFHSRKRTPLRVLFKPGAREKIALDPETGYFCFYDRTRQVWRRATHGLYALYRMISNRLQRMLEHEVPLLSDAGFKQRVLDDVVAATIAATDRLLHNPPNLIEVKAWLDRAVRPI